MEKQAQSRKTDFYGNTIGCVTWAEKMIDCCHQWDNIFVYEVAQFHKVAPNVATTILKFSLKKRCFPKAAKTLG